MSALDPTDVRAQERATADRAEKQRLISRQEVEDFKYLMSSKQGRRFMWLLLEKTGVFRSSFTGNSETFFREGERNVGLRYLGMINENCPEKYNLMITEQREYDDKLADNGRRNKHK